MQTTDSPTQAPCFACATSSNPADFCPEHMDLDYRGIQDSTGRRLRAILELGRVRDEHALANLRRYLAGAAEGGRE